MIIYVDVHFVHRFVARLHFQFLPNNTMAPVTRSKAGDVPAVVAPARPTKDASNKAGKLTAAKRPAAAAAAAVKAEATTSKVQKRGSRKKRKGKGRKTPSPPSSAEKSEKSSSSNAAPRKTSSSRGSAPKRSASKKSDEASSSSKKSKTDKTPRLAAAAAANGSGQDDFPELAQAYGFMPFIDQAQRQPTSAPRTPRLATDHVLRPDENVLMEQLAQHMVNSPSWSINRPGTGAVQGFGAYLPRGFELAESLPSSQQDRGSSPKVHGLANDRRRREPRVSKRAGSAGRNTGRQAREQSITSLRVRRATRSADDIVRDDDAQEESEQSETPVSIKNTQVFKRPTVAGVRRERAMMHNELRGWVARLRRARDDFDAVIGEIEDRMQIIRAVSRMQAPLRKSPLGRGRGRSH
jgi:hypothetical protein